MKEQILGTEHLKSESAYPKALAQRELTTQHTQTAQCLAQDHSWHSAASEEQASSTGYSEPFTLTPSTQNSSLPTTLPPTLHIQDPQSLSDWPKATEHVDSQAGARVLLQVAPEEEQSS